MDIVPIMQICSFSAIFMMNTYFRTSPVSGQKGQILLRPTPAKQNMPRRILALLLLTNYLQGRGERRKNKAAHIRHVKRRTKAVPAAEAAEIPQN